MIAVAVRQSSKSNIVICYSIRAVVLLELRQRTYQETKLGTRETFSTVVQASYSFCYDYNDDNSPFLLPSIMHLLWQ